MLMLPALRTRFLALAALAGAVLMPAAPAQAQSFVATQLQNLISTENAEVRIEGLSGAFSGAVRIESLTVSDPDGVYLTARDLALDWSPTALIRRTVEIQRLTAGTIELTRLPAGTASTAEDESSGGGGFSLPNITANVGEISIGRFTLGQDVAGVAAELSATGSLQLTPSPAALNVSFDVERQDRPGTIRAQIAFAPDDNRLVLNVNANEPEGGIIAGLLKLPGAPPVTVSVDGNGPLSDFTLSGGLDIATERAITIDASVKDGADGRRLTADVTTITGPFVPAQYADMVGPSATVAADVLLRNQGGIVDIARAQLVSGALQLDAAGTYDPQGSTNDLRIMLATSEGDPVPLSFGALGSRSYLEISSLNATLRGALSAAALEVSAAARTAGYEDYLARDIDLRASSPGFDLNAISGPFRLALDAATASAPEGVAANILTGPIALSVDGSLTEGEIVIDSNSLTTGAASAAVTGRAARDFSTFDLALRTEAESAALSQTLVDYAGERISLRANLARTAEGYAGRDIALEGTGLSVTGSASLLGEAVAADLSGTLDQTRIADAGLTGTANFDLQAAGTLSAPQIDLTLNGADLDIAGRTLQEVEASLSGTFAPDAPQGALAVNGRFNEQPLAMTADFATENGTRYLRNLDVTQGDNKITGEIALDAQSVPSGALTIAAPDVSTLAGLFGQEASGAVNGDLAFRQNADGVPEATIDIRSGALAINQITLADAVIDVSLFDYVNQPQAEGRVEAAALSLPSLDIAALALDLSRLNETTVVDGRTTVNGVDTAINGTVSSIQGETRIDLRQLDAAINQADIALREPAQITIGQNGVNLGQIRLSVGSGGLALAGALSDEIALDLTLDAFPLAVANPFVDGLDAAGTLTGDIKTAGPSDNIRADFNLALAGLATSQTRQADLPAVDGTVAGRYRGGIASLDTARLTIGSGTVALTGDVGETLDAQLTLTDIPVALANGFVDGLGASGTISGQAEATGAIDNPVIAFDLDGRNITAERVAAAGTGAMTLDVTGRLANYTVRFDTAEARIGNGTVSAVGSVGRDLDLSLDIDRLPVAIANAFVPGLGATGSVSGTATAGGTLGRPEASFSLNGNDIAAQALSRSGVQQVALDIAGAYRNDVLSVERGRIQAGGGTLDISGTVGDTLDLRLAMQNLPLALANAASPDLGAQGTLSGTANATGSLASPAASFDVTGSNLSVAAARAAGAPAANLNAAGRYERETLNLRTARVDLAGGGNITATGSAGRQLNLDVTLSGVPAAIAAAAAPDIAPQGTIRGSVQARGTLARPSVNYDLAVDALSLAQTREAGVGPLDVAARGAYAGTRVTLDGRLAGAGLAFTANGAVNLAGTPAFDIQLNGNAPLALANRILAEGGRSIQGEVLVNARVAGTAAAPNVTGTVSTSGARFVDTGINLAIDNINTTIALSGNRATISAFSASLASGGNIAVSGGIGLNAGFPADIVVTIRDGRYADGELFSTRLNADLTLRGPLLGAAVLGGTINAQEIAIVIPDQLPSSLAELDVRHVNAPQAVYVQQRQIDPDGGATGTSGGGIALDLTLNAPNRVFVRGRGLDLELGGTIRITGPASNLGIVGGFDLQRGRLQILSRRLDFERASLSFTGNLIPTVDFLAQSDTGQATVYVAVTGPAQDPSFTFTSSPALPQDEVLARLIFGQATSDLSPLQIAQLASAAASLAGVGGSTGLLDSLRSQLGVDDIDIRTTADGQAAVGVGQYLNENTYIGVDTTGRVSIDLDLGRDIKARGAVNANGGGEVGIFYEKEY
ncbi:translocation/assembly module TamB domain-containing protein [Aureimonas frigidaquae]|uniref:translocation/assembly module TamB domain-containing protein n=1 Tax=Aureimonas frigidaquae TaxID=424757 RepID=UPI0007806043|nr:translocation/assembly module TamB domain-containing protein [Aureimonas frigidaquae]